MSAPTTLALREDDERTVVDPRLRAGLTSSDSRPSGLGPSWRLLPANLLARWRPLLGLIVAAALLGGLVGIVLIERRESHRLREKIQNLERDRQTRIAGEISSTLAPEHPDDSERDKSTGMMAAQPTPSRQELELQGAALLTANDYRAALDHYEMMIKRFPEPSVYSHLAGVLRVKLRCQFSGGEESWPCR